MGTRAACDLGGRSGVSYRTRGWLGWPSTFFIYTGTCTLHALVALDAHLLIQLRLDNRLC